jgi:hypothetical protein
MSDTVQAAAATSDPVVVAEKNLEAAVAAEVKGSNVPTEYDAILEAWMGQYIYSSPIAQSTAAWNYMTSTALPALRSALVKGQ